LPGPLPPNRLVTRRVKPSTVSEEESRLSGLPRWRKSTELRVLQQLIPCGRGKPGLAIYRLHKGSALLDRCARCSHRRSSGSAIRLVAFAAMVVSSFSPVAWPTPTRNPASRSVTRSMVLRE